MSELFDKIKKNIPLETRISTEIEVHFIMKRGGSLFYPADETSQEYKQIQDINQAAIREAKPLIEKISQTISRWKKDGCP